MKDVKDIQSQLEESIARKQRAHREQTDRAFTDLWGRPPAQGLAAADDQDLESRIRAFDARIQGAVDQHRNSVRQAVEEIWRAAPAMPTVPRAGPTVARPAIPVVPPINYRIDLKGQPALQLVDEVFRKEFALDRYLPKPAGPYPTIYCETLEEFFAPWAEILDISASQRQAFVVERASEARQAAEQGRGGVLGVAWPGRGCYVNGWLFGLGRALSAAAALQDPQILPGIVGTVVHEKWGHGFVALYTESGREKQQLDLGRFELAQRFGQRLNDSPEATLLGHKHALLWYTSRFLEEGWATWIEHYLQSRLCFGCDRPDDTPIPPPEPYTLTQVWEALQRIRLSSAAGDLSELLDAFAWALQVLFCSELVSQEDVHRATLILQDTEEKLAQPFGQLLGQPLPYVLGYLAMGRIEAQQGALCAPYAVAVAANIAFNIATISLGDLQHIVRSEVRMNLDTRFFLLSMLRLEAPGSVPELVQRAREELSLTAPESLRT